MRQRVGLTKHLQLQGLTCRLGIRDCLTTPGPSGWFPQPALGTDAKGGDVELWQGVLGLVGWPLRTGLRLSYSPQACGRNTGVLAIHRDLTSFAENCL